MDAKRLKYVSLLLIFCGMVILVLNLVHGVINWINVFLAIIFVLLGLTQLYRNKNLDQ
ncbi:MAG: hypothetical protein FWH29_04985 [Methanobrevibacter sp.]|nr:hypothetical protein [Methanobrevibacter sp.]